MRSWGYFNPRSPCGERHACAKLGLHCCYISIHAPRAGSDELCIFDEQCNFGISIHAPRAGSDGIAIERSETKKEFQSTLPVRGATMRTGVRITVYRISIHAPRAGSDVFDPPHLTGAKISIHAPRAGGDRRPPSPPEPPPPYFNPRPPCGGRRGARRRIPPCTRYFNPRPPCGGRPDAAQKLLFGMSISIHAPRAGGDGWSCTVDAEIYISIHAPRAGGDTRSTRSQRSAARFQSTPPVRGATLRINPLYYILAISIHAPRAGGDIFISSPSSSGGISIHAPRAGGDLTARAPTSLIPYFNPRPPCGGRLL